MTPGCSVEKPFTPCSLCLASALLIVISSMADLKVTLGISGAAAALLALSYLFSKDPPSKSTEPGRNQCSLRFAGMCCPLTNGLDCPIASLPQTRKIAKKLMRKVKLQVCWTWLYDRVDHGHCVSGNADEPVIRGFRNIGNTCFMNSILQVGSGRTRIIH